MEGRVTITDSRMKTAQVTVILTCWIIMTVTYYFYTEQPNDVLVCDTTRLAKTRLPDPVLFGKLDHVSKSELFAKCIDFRLLHIGGLEKQVHRWKISKHKVCVELYNLFSVIFKIESRTGQLNVTDTFRKKLLKWFGGNQNLVGQAEKQTVIFVTNKWTYDATVFNPIREKRPIVRPNVTDTQYVNQLADKAASSCDFCNYKDATSPDFYGRIETPHCYTASNAFKLDAWHALVIFREHHPLRWTEEALMDVFNTAMKWFRNINKHHPEFVYPLIFWDLLPHASASQVHPHIHLVITNSGYWGMQEEWRQVGMQYTAKVSGRDYFSDLTAIHDILGLNTRHGSATAFASLTPKKDHEVVITSRIANEDFFRMIYYVTRGFIDDLERLCYSMSIALPAMKPVDSNFNMSALLRVVTRGSASEIRSDVSSMELFAASNVNIDPFKTAKVVSNSVKNRSKR